MAGIWRYFQDCWEYFIQEISSNFFWAFVFRSITNDNCEDRMKELTWGSFNVELSIQSQKAYSIQKFWEVKGTLEASHENINFEWILIVPSDEVAAWAVNE